MNSLYNRQSIKRLTIIQMKKKLHEWHINYEGFGKKRALYEHAMLYNPQNFPLPPSQQNKSKKKRKKKTNNNNNHNHNNNRSNHTNSDDSSEENITKQNASKKRKKPKKPSANILNISSDDTFENEVNRINKLTQNKCVKKKKPTKTDQEEYEQNDTDDSLCIVDLESDDEVQSFADEYNDYAKKEIFLLTNEEISKLIELGIDGSQIKQMMSTADNILLFVNLTGDLFENKLGKIICLKDFVKAKYMNQHNKESNDKQNESANRECININNNNNDGKEFKFKFDTKNPDYQQFNKLYKNKKYQFPDLKKKVYFNTRHQIKLEMIKTMNNYDDALQIAKKKQKNAKISISLKSVYPLSSSNLHYRHSHFMTLMIDENKYEKTIKKQKQWMKKADPLLREVLISIADDLTDQQKKEYKFSVPEQMVSDYNALFGNIWTRINNFKVNKKKNKNKKHNDKSEDDDE